MTEQQTILRVVFDCGVFLQGLISVSGPAVACLELFEKGKVTLFISEEILTEIQDVLSRSKLRAKYSSLTTEKTDKLIASLRFQAQYLAVVPKRFTYDRDPDDEPYINLAVEADAQYIVSRDKDLLDLMTGHTKECKEFRQRFRPLKVIEPQEFLKIALSVKEE